MVVHMWRKNTEADQYLRDKLMEHYHNPRNVGQIDSPDFSFTEYNHSCGDQIKIEGRVDHGILIAVSFIGSGCILSQAAASMLTDSCKGKEVGQIIVLDKEYVQNLIGIPLGPTRLRCALLSLYALQHGLREYLKEQHKVSDNNC
jgi:nitrogen fixation protein NifU and related proteins